MRGFLLFALVWAPPAFADPVNAWIALRDDAQGAVATRLQCDQDPACVYVVGVTQAECDAMSVAFDLWLQAPIGDPPQDCGARGPIDDRQARVFQAMHDRANVQRLFRVDTQGLRQWSLWSLYFDGAGVLARARAEIDHLVATYPQQIRVAGCWFWDGRQCGTQWAAELAGDCAAVTGSPLYPIPARLIESMPDVDDSGTRPTELSDVNLAFGQAPRCFE